MFGKKKNKIHSTCSLPSKGALHTEQQLSLLLQQVSSQLNLMLSLQQQQQQQYLNNLISVCGSCTVNELGRQGQHTSFNSSHHQRHCSYQNDVLIQPPILSYSQPSFCGGTKGPYAPTHPQQNYHQCAISPSASSLLSSTQHPYSSTCPHDTCHQRICQQQYHNYNPSSQYEISPICPCSQQHPPATQQHYPTRMDSISGRTDGATSFCSVTGTFNKQPNYSDPPLGNQSKPATTTYARTSTRTKSRSRTDPLPPVPSFGNDSFGNNIGSQDPPVGSSFNIDPLPPAAENLFMQDHQPELSCTDIYRQDLRARPDALASPPGSSISAIQTSVINATHTRIKAGQSHLRDWWLHGKYKWGQIRKRTSRVALF